jgi:beta-fructofuranosidase
MRSSRSEGEGEHWTRREFLVKATVLSAVSPAMALQTVDPPAASTAALRAAVPLAARDPERPVYHFRPPANWTNDPNGTIYHNGWHHLFYQLNPAEPRGGNQHWGHARSRDLVNWEHLPIALWPLTARGERAIYSGGAIPAPDGRPRIFYTSIGHEFPQQWIAIPEDDELIRWSRPARNPVLTIDAHGALVPSQWRDPFLFRQGRDIYMVCGGNVNDGRGGGGAVFLYKAANADLTRWQYVGVVYQQRDRQYFNIECPNLFPLGDKWVLLISPHRPVQYFVGTLDLAKPAFVPETQGVVDPGDAYASNISVDDKGRVILWLWGRTRTAQGKGWNGVILMPRVLSLDGDGFLRQQPAPEFETLRRAHVTHPPVTPTPGTPIVLDGISGDCLELAADIVTGNTTGGVGFDVRRSADGTTATKIRILPSGVLAVGEVRAPLSRGRARHVLKVFLDKRVFEVYANDGEAAIYGTIDASPANLGVAVAADPLVRREGLFGPPPPSAPVAPRVDGLEAWTLAPARFDLGIFGGEAR